MSEDSPSEASLIERIRRLFPRTGDDAAVIGNQVLTNDMLVEDVDFTREVPLRSIARKCIAANVSDLAAMGARPLYALVAVGAPEWVDVAVFLDELAAAASLHGIEIVGGDLSTAGQLVVSVTAIGEAARPILRRGARPGDRVYVSRPLGASAAGLHLLRHGWRAADTPGAAAREIPEGIGYSEREFGASAIRRHLEPDPEVDLGLRLVGIATACIDISDGLSTDLHHLCDASGVGAEIVRERIPLFPGLVGEGAALGIPVAESVLNGGEEYALLFTAKLRESELSARVGRPVYAIGRITADLGVRLDGQPLAAGGWDHFLRPVE